jgi:hypothetical protein
MQPKLFNFDRMLKRINKARQNKSSQWESHLRECYRYALPESQTFDHFSPGQKKREYVYDSTAEYALEDYASRMESQLVPAWRKWFMLEAGNEVPEKEKAKVEEYLEEATDIIFHHINHSNFNGQIKETFLDLGISTGSIIVEEGDGIQSALNFRSVSLSEVLIEKSALGIVETVWREIKVNVQDIKYIWPNATLNEKLNQMLNDNPEVDLIEGVVKDEKTGMYITMLLDEKNKDVLLEEQDDSSVWIVFRESTIPGEVYGRGRIMRALPDIKTLNKMVEDHLRAAAFTANPIFTATDDGIINPYTVSLQPGTVMPVGSNDRGNPSLAPLVTGGDYNVLQYDISRLQESIRTVMISKPFGSINDTPVRTATEMSIRDADTQATAGSATGKLQTELLERLLNQVVKVLVRLGKLVPMKIDGKEITIKFTSPMARQQDSDEIMQFMKTMEILQMFPPEVVQREIKVEDGPGYIIDKMGIPKTFKRSDLEKKELDEQQQAQMEAMAAAQGEKSGNQ